MKHPYFQTIEHLENGHSLPLNEVISHLSFNEQGLIPVIAQDASSKQVLMMAWMNKAALAQTIFTGRMTYWSRSRNELWQKGLSSGNTQILQAMAFDCDGDTILCQVSQKGGACHTGRSGCFYLEVDGKRNQVTINDPKLSINSNEQ